MDAPLRLLIFSPTPLHRSSLVRRHGFRSQAVSPPQIDASKPKPSHKPGPLDGLFQHFFRAKLAEEVGWDSQKPGYAGLIEVVNRLMMKGRSNSETEQAAVRVLESLFPSFVLVLFKMLIAPIGGGKVASMMVARATALSCQWLMGPCSINSVELLDGSSCTSGVFVERCKYLEESKCVGICINTCKLPTQTFFKDSMGVPLYMEPNFSDYSCQFKFGVTPPGSDKALSEPCLEIQENIQDTLVLMDCCRRPKVEDYEEFNVSEPTRFQEVENYAWMIEGWGNKEDMGAKAFMENSRESAQEIAKRARAALKARSSKGSSSSEGQQSMPRPEKSCCIIL